MQRGVGTSAAGVASFAGSVNFASLDLAESTGTTARFALGSFGAQRATAGFQSGRLGASGLKAYVRGSYQATDGFRENSAIQQTSVYAGLSHESEKGYFKLFGFLGREKSQSAYYAVEPRDPRGEHPLQPAHARRQGPLRPAVRRGAVHALPERDDEPRRAALRRTTRAAGTGSGTLRRPRCASTASTGRTSGRRLTYKTAPRPPRPDVGRPRKRLRQHADPRHRRRRARATSTTGTRARRRRS